MSNRELANTSTLSNEKGLSTIINAADSAAIYAYTTTKQAVDIAHEVEDLAEDELRTLVEALPSENVAVLMRGSDDALRAHIAGLLDNYHLLMVLSHMHIDDEVDVLSGLDVQRMRTLLSHMRAADRAEVARLLQYPEKSAGGIMTTSFLALREDRTVGDCLRLIRAKGNKIEQIQTIYVLGMDGALAGYLDLRRILSSSRTLTIREIMERRVIAIDPYADQEEAAELVAKYNLNALPVVGAGQLLGVITVDDIIDVIIEEYDEDMLRLAGANEEETLDSTLWESVRMRLPWLLVNLATAFLASLVVKLFEGTIEQVVALSAIMTIVSGMGGNAGSQTMAIVVRHLSKETVDAAEGRRALGKEVLAGIINGAINGLVTGAVVAALYGNAYLSLIVLVAMIGNMVIAGTFGFLVPVVLKACHQDPAVSSTIFVTTATDVLGFFIFLGLAQLFLPMLA